MDFIINNGVLEKYNGSDRTVVIPNGVTHISKISGDIEYIKIPDSVHSIGYNAFHYNHRLKKVYITENLIDCGYDLFDEYNTVEYIGTGDDGKVQNEIEPTIVCSDKLLSVLWCGIPASWKRNISYYQLLRQGKTGEKIVPIVKKYISKNKKMFLEKSFELDDGELMKSLVTIGRKPSQDAINKLIDDANGKSEITAVLLNYKEQNFSKEEVVDHATDDIEKELGLKALSINDWRKIYTFTLKNGTAIISKYKGTEKEVYVPAKIGKYDTLLKEKIFADNEVVEKVYFMGQIEEIPTSCFVNCSNLKEVLMPNSVKTIGAFAFQSCRNLEKIQLSSTLEEIQEWAFSFCGFSEIIIPENVKAIGEAAFCYCSNLEHCIVPSRVKIGTRSFEACPKLAGPSKHIIINGSLFDSYSKEDKICVPEGVTRICSCAFEYRGTKCIILPEGVLTIEKEAFRNENLEMVYIPFTVKKIYAKAFMNIHGKIPRKLTIYGVEGSVAEKFARKYGIPFVINSKEEINCELPIESMQIPAHLTMHSAMN